MASPLRARRLTLGELRMEQVERIARPLTLLVCVSALAVSFTQIKWAAGIIGLPAPATWLFPLIIDLPALTASALTVALHDRPLRQRAYAWTVLVVFLSLSWFANGLHAVEYAHVDQLPAAMRGWGTGIAWALAFIPPAGASLGPHLYAYILRHGVRADEATRHTVSDSVARTTARPGSAPARASSARPAQPARATSAPAPARPAATARNDHGRGEARALFDQAVAADPAVKPDAAHIWRSINTDKDRATVRRWVSTWWDEHGGYENPPAIETVPVTPATARLAEIDAATPDRDPLADLLADIPVPVDQANTG